MALLAPDVHADRAARRPSRPPDRAPDWLAAGTPRAAARRPERAARAPTGCSPRALDLVRYASDASPYRLFPKAVVMAHDADDVAKVLAYGAPHRHPGHASAPAGTSLNGQGAERRHPRRRPPPLRAASTVEDDGARARVAPGHRARPRRTGCSRRYGRKLGPDPASTDFATVGGVIANNSGGMRCGVVARLLLDACAR